MKLSAKKIVVQSFLFSLNVWCASSVVQHVVSPPEINDNFQHALASASAGDVDAMAKHLDLVDHSDIRMIDLLRTAANNQHANLFSLIIAAINSKTPELLLAPDNLGLTPLHWASRYGHVELAECLLEIGAINVDDRDRSGFTPLLYAVSAVRNSFPMTRLLLLRKASPDLPNRLGQTPLYIAAFNRNRPVFDLLREYGANPNTIVNAETHDTLLHLAAMVKGISLGAEIAEWLLSAGAKVDAVNQDQRTPLHLACVNRKAETMEVLLRFGANKKLRDKDQKTPRELAPWGWKIEFDDALASSQIILKISKSEDLEQLKDADRYKRKRENAKTKKRRLSTPIKKQKFARASFEVGNNIMMEQFGMPPLWGAPSSSSISMAPEKGDCAVCFKENCYLSNCRGNTQGCKEARCEECVVADFDMLLSDSSEDSSCVACKKPYCVQVLRSIGYSDEERISKFLERSFANTVISDQPNWKFCPTSGCFFGQVVQAGEPLDFDCPICSYSGCIECGRGQHSGTCAAFNEEMAALRKLYELGKLAPILGAVDARDDSYFHGRYRPCPDCGEFIERVDGCNRMRCTRCNGIFDWNKGSSSHVVDGDFSAGAMTAEYEKQLLDRGFLIRFGVH